MASGPTSPSSPKAFNPVRLQEQDPARSLTEKGRDHLITSKTRLLLTRFAALSKRLQEFRHFRAEVEAHDGPYTTQEFRPIALKYQAVEETYFECAKIAQDIITYSANKSVLCKTYQGKLDEFKDAIASSNEFMSRICQEIRSRHTTPRESPSSEMFEDASATPGPRDGRIREG